ncbi:STAS/SEC14 domain-containing protein [Chitinolyticbacter meiyuanensis]|uniref:STAS/SEC14 domain-containing protein n=1 Tax=Chitinolyticbacter meiyuanensis TaxID=682798 RepID=UPI0011E5F83E|nr:STAS/SEC14 domain-containing protein [Chitinolyticbacter meiyuanensis]
MISISHEQNYVHVAVIGEFTVADFREFEENVVYEIRFRGHANLLFDLTEMISYTLDMAVEEVRFTREHKQDFGRVAVISDDQWVAWSAWLNQLLSDAEIELFSSVDAARDWLSQEGTDTKAPASI